MSTFATPAPITVVLNIPAGRVQFIATDRTDTTVEVLPADAAKSRDVKAAGQTTVDYTGGVLRIKTATKNQYLGSTGAVEVKVALPTGSHIQAKAEAAELQTTGRLGDVAFEGAYRRIKVAESASLHLVATDGDVEVGRLSGPAEITTASGDITVAEATGGKVVLRTQSGDITISAASGVSASLDAGTSNGRITNALTSTGAVELAIHATTYSGNITARSL
ncbi:DUF4097 family beta strand repeat-containing protein [Nonomuraea sp. NPDC050556]|uniref:DUF4097 family beta strand repeat-containing protein n=1 Tax=Nonomuraea sp. NPDC050556 TaxID=3364369 RepID=UPI0037B25575